MDNGTARVERRISPLWDDLKPSLAYMLMLLPLMGLAFAKSLACYFSSDDLLHVSHVAKALNGHLELIWLNFVSVWMQDPTYGVFYRPLIEPTILLDYLISGPVAFGYHVSNLIYGYLAACAVYLIAESLFREFGEKSARMLAFLAAALFAVNPLHTEVVTWMTGRVDGLCALFYLVSFWLYLKSRASSGGRNFLIASLLCFASSLLCKEMAVSLPFAVALHSLFFDGDAHPGAPAARRPGAPPGKSGDEARAASRLLGAPAARRLLNPLKQAALRSLPFVLVLVLFLILRALALGSFVGGYTGAIGDWLSATTVERIFNPAVIWKIAFPLNESIIGRADLLFIALRCMYVLVGTQLLVQLFFSFFGWRRLKHVLFLISWLILALLPTFQVFFVNERLQGARFMYLGTAMISMAIVLLLLPMRGRGDAMHRPPGRVLRKVVFYSGLSLSVILIVLAAAITYTNNLAWLWAGEEVRAVRAQINRAVESLPAEKKLLIAWVPQQSKGAHMFHNFQLLEVLMKPPLNEKDIAGRIAALEPRFYTQQFLVCPSAFRQKLLDKNYVVCWWNESDRKLEFAPRMDDRAEQFPPLTVAETPRGSYPSVALRPLVPIKTWPIEVVEVTALTDKPFDERADAQRDSEGGIAPSKLDALGKVPLLSWRGRNSSALRAVAGVRVPDLDGQARYLFFVSEDRQWFSDAVVDGLMVVHNPGVKMDVKSARLSDGAEFAPRLGASEGLVEGRDGVGRFQSSVARLNYDASKIKGASRVLVEISQPFSMFQIYSGTYRVRKPSRRAMKSWMVEGAAGSIELQSNLIPTGACCQVRVIPYDKTGTVCGFSSDPVLIGARDSL